MGAFIVLFLGWMLVGGSALAPSTLARGQIGRNRWIGISLGVVGTSIFSPCTARAGAGKLPAVQALVQFESEGIQRNLRDGSWTYYITASFASGDQQAPLLGAKVSANALPELPAMLQLFPANALAGAPDWQEATGMNVLVRVEVRDDNGNTYWEGSGLAPYIKGISGQFESQLRLPATIVLKRVALP
jgi:hypothetical protein